MFTKSLTHRAALRVAILDSIVKWGGGEKWCVDAARSLCGRGHHAVIACGRGTPLEARAREAGIETWSAPLSVGRGLISAFRLGKYLKRERIEAVIGNVGRDLWIGAIACRCSGAKLIQRRGLVRPVKQGLLSRWLYTRVVARVIVNSLAIRDCMLKSVDFLDPSVFVLIPNGIDTRTGFPGDRSRLRSEIGLPPGAPVAGTVGRLAKMKGHSDLLRAWPQVLSTVPDARLLVVGEGEEERGLKNLALQLGIEKSVSFLGFRRDVSDLLSAMDLLVMPSVRDEGCSNTLLESMWQGRPAVVTDCGGLPGVVTHGELGLVVPIHDPDSMAAAIGSLLASSGDRERMGQAARCAIAERYSLDNATDLLEKVLLSLRG